MTTPLTSTNSAAGTPLSTMPVAQSDREKLKETAKQFEAIFVRQILAEARKTNFDKDSMFGSQALDTFRQMQDERFAEIAADRGTLGLATIIEAQLARFVSQEPAAQGPEQK